MRKNTKLFALFTIAAFVSACTTSESTRSVTNSNASSPQSVDKQTYRSVGIIKNIDTEKGEITVDHEDIPGYMSAMEMTGPVKEKALLGNIKVGDKVDFEIERIGSNVTYTRLIRTGDVAAINGAETYKTSCSECHGEKGEGTKKGIPLTSGHALHHSETEHIKQVTDGEGERMPAFRDKLRLDEIKAVVNYVRNEIQKNAKREDSHKHSH